MTELFEAIKNYYESQPISERAGLFAYRAPEKAVLPYVTYMLVTSKQDEESFDARPEAMELRDIFVRSFDIASLSIAGWSTIRCKRETENLVEDPDGGFTYHIDYRLLTQKS
jgi:hypothetical protein